FRRVLFRSPEHREDVGVEGLLELLVADLGEALRGDLFAGVVDEDVQPAQLADRTLDHLGAERRVDEVTGDGGGVATAVGDDLRDVLRSEEHTSELQSRENLVCRLLLEKKKHTIRVKDVL